MVRIIAALTILVFFSGCGLVTLTTTSIEASGHKDNFSNIKIGMSSDQVKGVLGTPNKTESFSLNEGRKILVWFFLTEGRAPFHRLDDTNYTPIVFENEILTGWGYVYLNRLRN
jgi:hypothetical protein